MRLAFIVIDKKLIMDILTLKWRGPDRRIVAILITRFYLISEFLFCVYIDRTWLWLAQFAATTWWNLFLIVSSHDFEESESKADRSNGQDWGVY